MYHEFRSGTKRDGWTFTYQGSELLPFARERLDFYAKAEKRARQDVSDLMLDQSVAASDKRILEAKNAVEINGSLHEQLTVWVHEFQRTPDREYFLSLGDVVFFKIPEAIH